jgi:signal transduction histidine kinase
MRERGPSGGRQVPETRIITWFALTSLVVFVLIGVGITWFRARDVRVREERAAASRAELVANEAVGPVFTAEDLAGPISGARYDVIQQRVDAVVHADPGILRIKVWGTDGTVLYSNEPAEVGTKPEMEEDLEEAIDGELASEVSDLTADENIGERMLGDRLFETYVPFRLSPDGPVVAVFEAYQDYSVIEMEISRLTRTLSISLGAGLIVLYAVVLPLMIGITRRLRRQNAQLQAQATQLSDLLEREQTTVAELRALDRMKSDFVAATSHELRTPLTSIRGYVHMLRDSTASRDPIAAEAISAIERQSGRLFRMIANVLRESNLEDEDTTDAASTFDFRGLVQEAIVDFHGSGERISNDVPGELGPVTCDRLRVQDILVNLLDNALKYSMAPDPVSVGARVGDGRLTFWVTDRGIGIASGDLPRVFDRFYQVDQSSTRAYGGVGLGLHIVQGLVEALDGRIEVRSEPGDGSTFTVTVPIGSASVPTAESAVRITRG